MERYTEWQFVYSYSGRSRISVCFVNERNLDESICNMTVFWIKKIEGVWAARFNGISNWGEIQQEMWVIISRSPRAQWYTIIGQKIRAAIENAVEVEIEIYTKKGVGIWSFYTIDDESVEQYIKWFMKFCHWWRSDLYYIVCMHIRTACA